MSNSKMLIDASHPEETRVVVLKGNRIEEFDFESASRKQLRGNIYLAKVTRVEPSLQAAFVEYGGNRHGFLAFSEIHPDYYQIPFADRQALLEEEARANRDEDDEGRGGNGAGEGRRESRGGNGGNGGGESRGEGRSARGDRNERGGRGERSERGGERNQRRSRRHRRDGAAPLDRRGPADESLSEPVSETVESDDAVALLGVDVEDAASLDVAMESGGETSDAAPVLTIPLDAVDEAASEFSPAAEPLEASEDLPGEAVPADAMLAEAPAEIEVPDEPTEAADEVPPADDELQPAGFGETAGDAPEIEALVEMVAEIEADGEAPAGMPFPADEGGDEHERDERRQPARSRRSSPDDDEHHAAEDEHVEQIGGDALSDVAPRPVRLRRHYKIQEVIKRRQILLIQVVKEERGNKGAALTTYLSLAGRYSVLMPNTAKGGGISRKITDGDDRKRLKAIAQELDVPEGMGVILRTAGAARSPVEVRRDFEYLLRMWESVRELTLKSSAPTLVYEEGSLIKRSIRDLYGKEVEEIVVAGEAGFGEARDFMRMLMPGNVKSVQHYRDPQPIFAKSGVEAQLDAMFSPQVTLKSGGYLVINQTEALVAIDVNSGRSTREHNIEDTALRTNMEAADEVARQLRLRDLAGLIVVDFIDMEEGRNNRAVERRIKEALKNDRARIQIGRISHFGLLEMSRQRIRTGVLEGSTAVCPHCAGTGTVRSTASIALHVLRLVEDALMRDATYDLIVRSRSEVALYVLNQKRAKLVELEQRFGITITVTADPTLTGMVYHAIERGELATPAVAPAPRQNLVRVDSVAPIFEPDGAFEEETVDEAGAEAEPAVPEGVEDASAEGGERRRKRRRRRRGREREGGETAADAAQPSDDGDVLTAEVDGASSPLADGPDEPSMGEAELGFAEGAASDPLDVIAPSALDISDAAAEDAEVPAAPTPRPRRSRRTAARIDREAEAEQAAPATPVEDAPARPRRRRPSRSRGAGAEGTPLPEIEIPSDMAEAPSAAAAPVDAEPVGSRPSADRDVGADTVEHHAPETEPEAPAPFAAESTMDTMSAPPEPAPAPKARPVPATPVPAEADPDPDRPKRSGWWQRAKASFGT